MNRTFSQVERWDIAAVFDQPVGPSRVAEVRALRGVNRVQPALVIPVKVTHGGAEANVSLTAMSPEADFHGFTGTTGAAPAEALAAGEVVLAESTAQKLGVGIGQTRDDRPTAGRGSGTRAGRSAFRRDTRPARVRVPRDRRRHHRRADEPLQRPVPELRRFRCRAGSRTRSTTCPAPRVSRSRRGSSRS